MPSSTKHNNRLGLITSIARLKCKMVLKLIHSDKKHVYVHSAATLRFAIIVYG